MPGMTSSASSKKKEEGEGAGEDLVPPKMWGSRCHYGKVTSSDGIDGKQHTSAHKTPRPKSIRKQLNLCLPQAKKKKKEWERSCAET